MSKKAKFDKKKYIGVWSWMLILMAEIIKLFPKMVRRNIIKNTENMTALQLEKEAILRSMTSVIVVKLVIVKELTVSSIV